MAEAGDRPGEQARQATRSSPAGSVRPSVPGDALIRMIESAGLFVAGSCIVAIMLVISADALGRYALRAPLQWATDVVSAYLMVVAVYFGISATFRSGDHISINLLQSRMSRPVKAATGILYSGLAAAVFATVAWGAAANTIEAFQTREFLPGYLPWPLWLSHLPIALGSALLAVRLLHHAAILGLRGDDPAVALDGEHPE